MARFPALNRLGVGPGQRIPYVAQTAGADCGPACLTMVLAHHGKVLRVPLFALAVPLLIGLLVDRVVPRANIDLLNVLGAGLLAMLLADGGASLWRPPATSTPSPRRRSTGSWPTWPRPGSSSPTACRRSGTPISSTW